MKRWILLLGVASCGDNLSVNHGDAGPPIDGHVDAQIDASPPQMGTVTITALDHHLTEAGDVTAPATDLKLIDNVGNLIIPSSIGAGVFQFVNVAPGAYLACDTSYASRFVCFQSNATTLDLSKSVAGRPGFAVGSAGTTLDLTMSNLTALSGPNDFLDVRSLNTNYIEYPVPPAGTTLVQNLNYFTLGLLTAPDVLRATQFVTKSSGSETYVAASRTGEVTGVDMTNATNTAAAINLSTVLPQTTTHTFNLRRSQFVSVAGSPGPGLAYQQVDINAYAEARPYDWQPWVFYYTGTGPGNTDLPLTVSYGNPAPSSYVETFEAAFWFTRNVMAVGSTIATPVTAFLATYRPSSELTGDITPKLSRITNLTVNGLDASTAHTGTTETPTIAWTAPSVGTATHYTVNIYRVLDQGGTTIATVDGVFTTTGTSFKVPSGFIHAGESYLVLIRAYMYSGFNASKPYTRPDHYDLADTLSELQQP